MMTAVSQAGARVLGIGRGQSHRAHRANLPVTVRNGAGESSVALASLAWRGHHALPPVGVTDQAVPEAVSSTSPACGAPQAQRTWLGLGV